MKLNHLNLTVPDVRETRAFLETYFGLQGTTNPYTGEAIPPGRAHGAWTFYFRAPGGFVMEVMA